MSPPVFPESSGFMPNSLSNKITMEDGTTENEENKEEGESFFYLLSYKKISIMQIYNMSGTKT